MNNSQAAKEEALQARRALRLWRALDGGIQAAVSSNGGELSGITLKLSEYDCLAVVKAVFPGGQQVAFVGGETVTGVLLKVLREARAEDLRWKVDQWAPEKLD